MRRVLSACFGASLALALQGAAMAATASAPARAASMSDLDQEIANAQQEQQRLLAQVRRDIAAMPVLDPRKAYVTPAERELEEKRQQMLELLATIEKKVNSENSRPWRRYISPSTREPLYSDYYHATARRIEEVGTRDFPTVNGQKLYGELVLNVTIDAKGRVIETETVRGSGNALLDRKAAAIVRAAAPFAPFSSELRKTADQVVVTSHFRFVKDGGAGPQAAPASDADARP